MLAAVGELKQPGGLPAIKRALFALRMIHDRLAELAMLAREADNVCPASDSHRLFFETQVADYTNPAIGFTSSLPGNTLAASAR